MDWVLSFFEVFKAGLGFAVGYSVHRGAAGAPTANLDRTRNGAPSMASMAFPGQLVLATEIDRREAAPAAGMGDCLHIFEGVAPGIKIAIPAPHPAKTHEPTTHHSCPAAQRIWYFVFWSTY